MRDLNSRQLRSRVKGRSAIEKSLHSLHRRVYRFATLRAKNHNDYDWALRLASALQAFVSERIEP